jgi:hypothetical protein
MDALATSSSLDQNGAIRFRLAPKRIEDISLIGPDGPLPAPRIAEVILRALLQSDDRKPLCVLLPSTNGIPELISVLAAIECLAIDFSDAQARFLQSVRPGDRLRALPEGNVYIVGQRKAEYGEDGIYLHYTEKDSLESNGCHWIRIRELLRYEPTERRLPISRSTTKLAPVKPTLVDELAKVRALGNSALYRTRVVLVGRRTSFEKTVEGSTWLSMDLPLLGAIFPIVLPGARLTILESPTCCTRLVRTVLRW